MVAATMRSSSGGSNRSNSRPVAHKHSSLLTREENEQIFRLLDPRCQTLATAVVQLFVTTPPDHSYWNKRDTGILCLVKDNPRKSYFFRLYCLTRKIMLWEYEVYNNIEYKSDRPFLHTFEAEECMAGFNFASEEEASNLRSILLEKLAARQRREERKARNSLPNSTRNSSVSDMRPQKNTFQMPNVPNVPNIGSGFANKTRNKRRRHLTKADIGMPKDFKHVSHIGWNPDRGFDMDNVDDNLKEFFAEAGVSESQLHDEETCQFIYDFIDTHGGIDAVKKEVRLNKRSSSIPPVPNEQFQTSAPPPPVPARSTNMVQNQQRIAPPPPPSRSRSIKTPSKSVTPTPGVPPPPPPPPPPMSVEAPTISVSNLHISESKPDNSLPDQRSALLESIRSGTTLKHVDPETKSNGPSAASDSRSDLLSEIRQGIELRSVTTTTKPRMTQSVESQSGLAGALARALAERSRAIHSDSNSSTSDSSDYDEWGD